MLKPTPQPKVILLELTSEELESKQVGSYNFQAAVEALHRDGLVVLKNAIDPVHLDKLNERMIPEAKILYSEEATARNFGPQTGNIQQGYPVDEKLVFEDVIANPWAVQIIECMMGPNPMLRCLSANTAFKAEGRQPVHIDIEFDMPKIPFGFCVNINLVDVSSENGATEVWLGTHIDTDQHVLDPAVENKVQDELVKERRKIRPPVQPSLPKRSLIIRDFRLWHAGIPNRTDEPGMMLVTVQFPKWYRNDTKIVVPESLRGKIYRGGLVPCVNWVSKGYDCLKGEHTHDFSLKP